VLQLPLDGMDHPRYGEEMIGVPILPGGPPRRLPVLVLISPSRSFRFTPSMVPAGR
jgi:hypothetical protein